MIKIEFLDGRQPLEIDAETISAAVENAVKSEANLREADLRVANLREADLRGADLSWTDLRGANLIRADLREADLSEADLSDADLREADLRGANLRGADLRGANLREADLRGADLSGTDLRGASLGGADLSGSNVDFSCWPLCFGSLGVRIDKRIFCQLIYHALRAGQSVEDPEVKKLFEIPKIVNLANQFHWVDECGKIELKVENNGK